MPVTTALPYTRSGDFVQFYQAQTSATMFANNSTGADLSAELGELEQTGETL